MKTRLIYEKKTVVIDNQKFPLYVIKGMIKTEKGKRAYVSESEAKKIIEKLSTGDGKKENGENKKQKK